MKKINRHKKKPRLIVSCAMFLWLSVCTALSGMASVPPVMETDDATPTASPSPSPTPTEVPMETPAESPASTFSVTYLDVGQGDSALVECDGRYMLIDGGEVDCASRLYSYLKKNGIDLLNIVVASHAHSDHVGGLSGALNYAGAELVLCPVAEYDADAFRDFAKYAAKNGPGITVPEKGSTYSLGSAQVKILGLNAGTAENDASIILRVEYRDKVFLFTGDAEREAEQAVLAFCPEELPAYVLKVGHHGSADATTYPFLREVMPDYAVISCGKDNEYGHPTEEVLSRLRDANVTVLRTDVHGNITIGYDGSEWYVATEQTEVPENITYIANRNSKKFHYPDCEGVGKMKEGNKVFFEDITSEEMQELGYEPCGICKP